MSNYPPINMSDPVNRHHPLNRNRVGWWLPVPGVEGGRYLYDLMGLYHGSLLTASSWGTSTRPGSFGKVINTDASAGTYVDCGTPAGLNGATKATYAGWVFKASNAVTAGFGGTAGTAGSGGNRFSFIWYTDGVAYFTAEDTIIAYGSCSIAVGWRRVAVVFDGSATGADRLKVYVDGLPQTLSFAASIPANLGNVGPFTIGRDSSDRTTAGSYDDVSLWTGRALTAQEAREDYDLSRTGYPGVLNRRARTTALSSLSTQVVSPSGIGSTTSFGTLVVAPGAATVAPSGVGSTVAFGTLVVANSDGVISPEAIDSTVAFGDPEVSADNAVVPSGMPSTLTFGTLVVAPGAATVAPSGVGSTVAFGTLVVAPGEVQVAPEGIGSTFDSGTPEVLPGTAVVAPGSITGTTFGTPTTTSHATISPEGVGSTEAFGDPVALDHCSPSGIASTVAFGSPTTTGGTVTFIPTGFSSTALGTPLVSPGGVLVAPTGIPSTTLLGTPLVSPGVATVAPGGVGSTVAFGTAVVTAHATISPNAIGSTTMVGVAVLTAVATISHTWTPSTAFGTTVTTTGPVSILVDGIESTLDFGTPEVIGQCLASVLYDLGTYVLAVTGHRLHFGRVPQGTSHPYLMLSVVSVEHHHCLDGAAGLAMARIQISTYASDSLVLLWIGETLRQTLDGFAGTMVDSSRVNLLLDNEITLYDPAIDASDIGLHHLAQDYFLSFPEGRPRLAIDWA